MANDNLDPNNPNNEAPPGQHANGGGNESGGGDKPLPEETPEPDKGNPRPFPNPARRKVDRDNTRIFAFLVGVNSYQGPITKLNGCVRDVNNIAGYLRARFGDDDQKDAAPIGATESVDRTEVHQRLFMRSLTNAEATYDNVIAAFQEHLLGVREAGVDSDVPVPTGDDTFWFHFSGHGSEQFTAEELLPQDPNGKDQTLVCYNPGGHTTGIFLADKELAILIDRINSRIRTLTKRPHVLVTLDACHSGSGTRDFLEEPGVQTRNFEFLTAKTRNDDGIPPGHIRTIDTYFGDLNPANPVIPESSHLLIAACSNVEKAGDLGKLKGGVFTSSLVEVLGEYGADEDVPYYDLFERTRSRARSKRSSQHAQFESIGNFNTYTSWLEGYRVEDKGKRYKILPDGDGWSIQCGVLHGLPTELDRSNLSAEQQADAPVKTMIEVFLGDESLGFAEVTDIGLQDSTINLILDDGVELEKRIIDADDGVFESAHPYYGVIFSLPAPAAYVWVHGHEATVELLKQQWDEELEEGDVQLRNLNIIPVDQEGDSRGEPVLEVEATLEPVRLEDGSMTEKAVLAFRSTETGLSWTTLNEAQSLEFIPVAKENIEKIIRWHRFYDMDNDKTKLREEFEMQFLESDKIALDPNSDIRSQLRGHNTTELKLYRGPSTFFRQTINNKAVDVVPY
ncbi:MAG: caspase family protein, partial [Bacteroidota bacterium]